MSAFTDFHQEALEEAIQIYGTLITYNNANYRAVVNSLEVSSELRDGGLFEQLATTIIVKRAEFTTAPKAGDRLTADGKTLRISKVDADEVSYTLICIAAGG